jgi:hemolysin III
MKHTKLAIIEEICNSVTHGIGALASIVALVILLLLTRESGPVKMTTFIIFGTSLILMYSMSTLFHGLTFTKARKVFLVFDQAAIYLLIAGTYTPLVLLLLHGWIYIGLLITIWALAITGIVFSSVFINRYKIFFIALYLVMGWISLFIFKPLVTTFSITEIVLLLSGGVLYTTGILFYAWTKLPFHHTIGHLFVMGGCLCHFLSIYKL